MPGSGSMQDIKRRIKSVTSIEHITNAMQLVSAAKLRHAKGTFEKTLNYFHYVTEAIEDIFLNTTDLQTDYLAGSREIKRTCYVVVTSNRGLAGGFNSNVIKRAEREMKHSPETPLVYAIGGKGRDYFKRKGYKILGEYHRPPESIAFRETYEITKPIIKLYDEKEIDEVILIYTSYVSPIEQDVKRIRLLPFSVESDPEIMPHDKWVEYEPSAEELFNYLVPKYAEIKIYGAIVESATCEHAARRMAMQNATDNAQDMIDNLNLYYNRARQTAITNEIIEIVSGSEILN